MPESSFNFLTIFVLNLNIFTAFQSYSNFKVQNLHLNCIFPKKFDKKRPCGCWVWKKIEKFQFETEFNEFCLCAFVSVKPFIIKQPENISIVAGEEIRLGCVVGGRPPPEIRWWRQNGQLPANRVVVSDNSVLTVRNVIPDDEDVYVCQADNQVGSIQALANVQIHCKLNFICLFSNLCYFH